MATPGLVFRTGTMSSFKTSHLLGQYHDWSKRGKPCLIKPQVDERVGAKIVWSRVPNLSREADVIWAPHESLQSLLPAEAPTALFVDEAQFLTPHQVDELFAASFHVPVFAYGLLTDYQGQLFPGSARLVARAPVDYFESRCHLCNRPAQFNLRVAEQAPPPLNPDLGIAVELGTEDHFVPACATCFQKKELCTQKKTHECPGLECLAP